MGDTTGIEWTDSTFNPWIGCTKIAPACDHCYAAALDKRMGAVTHWGNVPRRRTSEHNWHEPLRWQKKADEFGALHGRRRRVFCASMADVFDNQVDPAWRADLWSLIKQTPDLDWQLLTKRPQNIEKMKPSFWDEIRGNVWLGTTVEDQEHADQNIPHLLTHDSAVRFLSCEPLLGRITFRWAKWHQISKTAVTGHLDGIKGIDWVIAGGESGHGARPTNPDWFRTLRDECDEAGVPFLFKQWGDWVSVSETEGAGPHFHFDDGRTVRRIGKKLAGRTLDHVTHDGYPA